MRVTTVIVPIFNAPDELAVCLQSLQEKTPARARVILIDDASTDPRISQLLAECPKRWTVVENEKNIGFVATANLGMTLADTDDVVLLNADAEVTHGWLDLLEECMGSDHRIASVSPLTNHGEIASIPVFCQANPYPNQPEAWAEACVRSGALSADPPIWCEVPTTIGFCMLIRREAIQEVGYFDEQAFGLGYGEENDWCQRAREARWRHVLCDRAFVAHCGGASFGPLGLAPGGEAMEVLRQRYPSYEHEVMQFIAEDPMAKRRQAIVEYYEKNQKPEPHD